MLLSVSDPAAGPLPACQFWLEYLKPPTFGGQYAWAPCLSSWPRNRGNLTDYYNEFCWWWGWQQQASKPPIIAEADTSFLPYSGLSDAERRRHYAMQANLPFDCMGEWSAAATSLSIMVCRIEHVTMLSKQYFLSSQRFCCMLPT
jgi:hypothetical protein